MGTRSSRPSKSTGSPGPSPSMGSASWSARVFHEPKRHGASGMFLPPTFHNVPHMLLCRSELTPHQKRAQRRSAGVTRTPPTPGRGTRYQAQAGSPGWVHWRLCCSSESSITSLCMLCSKRYRVGKVLLVGKERLELLWCEALLTPWYTDDGHG